MASVVFSGDIDLASKGALKLLREAITNCMTMTPWTGLEEEATHIRENGLRIGEILRTPRGWHKPEFSFAFQCWEICAKDMNVDLRTELKKVAKALFDRPACKNLRAIGLD